MKHRDRITITNFAKYACLACGELCDCGEHELAHCKGCSICWEQHHSESCEADECVLCGINDCPHDEPLHHHHDGCPVCDA